MDWADVARMLNEVSLLLALLFVAPRRWLRVEQSLFGWRSRGDVVRCTCALHSSASSMLPPETGEGERSYSRSMLSSSCEVTKTLHADFTACSRVTAM